MAYLNLYRRHRATIGYLVLLFALVYAIFRVELVTRDTNRILNGEVQEKDAQIAQLNYILGEQAVPAVTFLLRQCRAQGRDCPEVLLSPTEPPFDEQLSTQP